MTNKASISVQISLRSVLLWIRLTQERSMFSLSLCGFDVDVLAMVR